MDVGATRMGLPNVLERSKERTSHNDDDDDNDNDNEEEEEDAMEEQVVKTLNRSLRIDKSCLDRMIDKGRKECTNENCTIDQSDNT
jgi:hypothetical protein